MSENTQLPAQAGEVRWRYPEAGDGAPPTGVKLLLLTYGGICVTGTWRDDGWFSAWSPLPKRDKAKEARLR